MRKGGELSVENSAIALAGWFLHYPRPNVELRRQYPFHLIGPNGKLWDEQETFRAWNPDESILSSIPCPAAFQLAAVYILTCSLIRPGPGCMSAIRKAIRQPTFWPVNERRLERLAPVGDAFGLPAEQYAIKTGQHPRATTEANIATFKRQIKALGFSYDWSREIDTTDPTISNGRNGFSCFTIPGSIHRRTKAGSIETLAYPPELKTEEEKRFSRLQTLGVRR